MSLRWPSRITDLFEPRKSPQRARRPSRSNCDSMLSRQDLISPSRQDKNAGNSGDLVKHTVYLAMLNELVRTGAQPRQVRIVEAHRGKGVYVASNLHLRKAKQAHQYSTSPLGRAQAACFASPPGGLGIVSNLEDNEIAYAGSGALHARAVLDGLADSLDLFDSNAGVRSVANRVFSEDCFSHIRASLRTTDPDGLSEPIVLSNLRAERSGLITCCTSILLRL